MNFTYILGTIPQYAQTLQEFAAAGVSVKTKLRTTISNFDQVKLSKLAREMGSDKLGFFQTSGLIENDFK